MYGLLCERFFVIRVGQTMAKFSQILILFQHTVLGFAQTLTIQLEIDREIHVLRSKLTSLGPLLRVRPP